MPNRILREGILTSERIASLNWAEEVFYRRLMSVVDDYGRFYAKPALVRAACYPLHLDKVSDSDIEKWLTECVEAALVRVYSAEDGKRYVEMMDFRQQTRAKTSKYPDPPDECIAHATQVQASAHLDVVGGVVEDEDVIVSPENKFSDDDLRIAKQIFDKVKLVAPKAKEPNFDRWADDIRLMREQDGHSPEEIWSVFLFANSDSFWKANILSTAKLRKQFSTLHSRMVNGNASSNRFDKPSPSELADQAVRDHLSRF